MTAAADGDSRSFAQTSTPNRLLSSFFLLPALGIVNLELTAAVLAHSKDVHNVCMLLSFGLVKLLQSFDLLVYSGDS